jgi:hypothetical protein
VCGDEDEAEGRVTEDEDDPAIPTIRPRLAGIETAADWVRTLEAEELLGPDIEGTLPPPLAAA